MPDVVYVNDADTVLANVSVDHVCSIKSKIGVGFGYLF